MACFCPLMFSVLSWTQRLKLASQPGVYYLKTCSFTCLATDVSYWLGPQLNIWPKHLHITSTPGRVWASSQYNSWVPIVIVSPKKQMEMHSFFKNIFSIGSCIVPISSYSIGQDSHKALPR